MTASSEYPEGAYPKGTRGRHAPHLIDETTGYRRCSQERATARDSFEHEAVRCRKCARLGRKDEAE